MEHWEFLIQKQGDRSWLPLESPDVEILEGRYRVVVRSSRPDTDVEVRVVHQSSVPPKRKIQQRSRRTNAEGLVVVIPFTYLKPGIWELHCGSSTSEAQSWQYAVHLQVLPQEALLELPDVLEATTPTPPPESTSTEDAIAPAWVESDDARTVAPAAEMGRWGDGEMGNSGSPLGIRGKWGDGETSSSEPVSQSSADFVASEDVSPLAIALKETTYIAHRGQSLTISGQVEATTQIADTASQELTAAGELRICLCNPERGQVISEIRQPLMNKVLPSPFSCTIEIPADCQIQLILGQISLYGNRHEDHLASASDQASVLATQPFTITAGLEELLGVIASDQGKVDTQQPQPTPVSSARRRLEIASPPLNLALLDLVKTPKTRQPVRFQPAANQPLPPLIDPPKTAKLRPEPALPKFPRQGDEVELVEPVQPEVAGVAMPDVMPASSASEVMDTTTVPMQLDEGNGPEHDVVEAPSVLSAVDAAFQELKLQYRFWTRLNALAGDAEFSEPLKMESFTSDDADAVPDSSKMQAAKADEQFHFEPEADVAQEIVVDDEVLEPESATGDRQHQAALRLFSSPKTANDVVVPVPQLEIQRGELIAGQIILVRVQLLPLHEVQLAVKLWIQDCQTRLLLDGPRWINDLAPDGLGNLESTFDLTVPQGSVEVRFEAIAVDSSTQQESHKVSIDRTVVPPDLPVLQSLEDMPWTP